MSALKEWMYEQEMARREADSNYVEFYHGDGSVEDPFEHLLETMGYTVVDPAQALQEAL